jgi:type I restriction enzyme, S subunit
MSRFPLLKIGDIATVKGGKRLPKGMDIQDEETNHPYLRVVDFGSDGINRTGVKFISDQAFEYVKRYTITSKDVYVSIAGTIGRVGIVPEDFSGSNLTENAAKITNISQDVDARYLLYFLRSASGQGALQNKAGGTSQPKLALFRIEEIQFPCPPADEQTRIVDVLSTYDDLIENNERRIVLLEEAGRQLYLEWFVRLRFPGYEHMAKEKGVPQGWERMPFENALVLQRGFDLPIQEREDGDVPVYGSTGVVGFHDKPRVKGPCVVTGRSGTLGEVHIALDDFWPLNTALWVKEFRRVSPLFALFLMREMDLTQYNGGASVPTLDRKAVHRVRILVPPKSLLIQFDEFATSIFQQISKLEVQVKKLREARDLLLPRLLSGELSVSARKDATAASA